MLRGNTCALVDVGAAGKAVGDDSVSVGSSLADFGEKFALPQCHGHLSMPLLEAPVPSQTSTTGFDIGLRDTEGLEKLCGMLWVTERFLMAMHLGQRADIRRLDFAGIHLFVD